MLKDFQAFLFKTNALALAIGVIIGVALGTVVTSLVNDIIMPPIGLLLGGVDFAQLQIVLREATATSDPIAIRYGLFIIAVITFVIVALVVFWISRTFLPKDAPPPAMRTCPYCQELVSQVATRCKFCTSELTPDIAG
jgi:large conductance mechanosensitive channel